MKLGTNDIGSVYLGTNAVQKVYLGTNEVWSSYAYLLDDYSGAAAAYSLRLLRSAYSGSAIRVRRASDNTEQDIGFVNNVLDTASLTSFCSGTNGFVKTWYDQSGNGNDASQTTAASQPQIVSGGSVITISGIGASTPSIIFDGSNDFFSRSVFSWINYSMFSVQKANAGVVWQNGNSNGVGLNTSSGTSYSLYERGVADHNFGTRTNNLRLISGVRNQSISLLDGYVNTTKTTMSTSNAKTPTTGFYIGALDGNSLFFNGHQSELIFYTTNETSNFAGISTNINDFYSIY